MSRVALVTGGSRGIGAAISVALKAAGYKVAANYAGNDDAANAFKAATGSNTLTLVVLVTAVLGCLTAWNALLMAGTRVLFALGRAALAPAAFGASHPRYHTPALAKIPLAKIRPPPRRRPFSRLGASICASGASMR